MEDNDLFGQSTVPFRSDGGLKFVFEYITLVGCIVFLSTKMSIQTEPWFTAVGGTMHRTMFDTFCGYLRKTGTTEAQKNMAGTFPQTVTKGNNKYQLPSPMCYTRIW
jgi:hypothetical protein